MPQVGQKRTSPITGKQQVFNKNHRWENVDNSTSSNKDAKTSVNDIKHDFDNTQLSNEEIVEDFKDALDDYQDHYFDKYSHLLQGSPYEIHPGYGLKNKIEKQQEGEPFDEKWYDDANTISQMLEIVQSDYISEADKWKMQDLYDQLHEIPDPRIVSIPWTKAERVSGEKRKDLHMLAKMLVEESQATSHSEEDLALMRGDVVDYNPRLINMENAARDCFHNEDTGSSAFENLFGRDTHLYMNAATNYLMKLDVYELDYLEDRLNEKSSYFLDPYDNAVHSMVTSRNLYLSSVFPEKYLSPKLEQYDIDNVFVSDFHNGREYGNVYTVMQPDGSPMSFSVYEHRNTDSIIINGKRNWDGEELPYAADSKNAFFAEFSRNDFDQAADALAMYMKDAQNGELASTDHLVDTAQKIDHNEILSKTIPGYQEWLEQNAPMEALRITDKSDDQILRNLDFDVEE